MSPLKGSVIVTGANGGLGSAFVANLLKSPYASEYRAIYTVRNPATAHDLQATLKRAPKSHISETIALDLTSLENVRGVAGDINTRVANGTLESIRALVLNAGWQEANANTLKPQTFTEDGFEAQFGVNYLANFLFVLLLLQSMDKEHGRIVIVSSFTHDAFDYRHEGIAVFKEEQYKTMYTDTESLSKGIEYTDDGYKAGMRRYGASKLLMIMFMYELQRRLDSDTALSKISVLSLDPGAMHTGLTKTSPLFVRLVYIFPMLIFQHIMTFFWPNGLIRTTAKSSADLLLLCFNEEYLGKYPKAVNTNGSLRQDTSVESRDEMKQKQLWVDSLKLARIRDGDTALKNWQ